MASVMLGSVLGNAVIEAFGIDGKAHPVTGVELVFGRDELAQIRVSFVLQQGDLTNIDRMVAKIVDGKAAP